MTETVHSVLCQFCQREISPKAMKCGYCQEWLHAPPVYADGKRTQKGYGIVRGTPEARAVTKGLKDKEMHDDLASGVSLGIIVATVLLILGVFKAFEFIGLPTVGGALGIPILIVGLLAALANWAHWKTSE